MDAVESDETANRADENAVSSEVTSTIVAAHISDSAKGRSSRRKPNKTRRFVDSEDEGEEEEEEKLDEYVKERMTKGLSESGHEKSRAADDGADDGDEDDDDEEEELEEEEMEEDEAADPPHLPEGTVYVQPVAVDDSAPSSYHSSGVPYGRKTRTDVIPDHVMCTACEHRIPTNSIDHFYRHPVLRVLLCRRCIAVYETKPIRMGDDGLDDACRWCAEGGDLICCDFCNNAFCKQCIERNLGRQELHAILNAGDNEKWNCYVCNPQLLAKHVESCNAIIASVEERENVAHRRQKSGTNRSPKRNQPMPNKMSDQMTSMSDTAALASAIASQVMSANTGRRGVGRPRGRGSLTHGTSKGDVLYIRTPSGGVVGIPAKSIDQLANVPLTHGSVQSQAKPRLSTRGSRSPRGSSNRSQFVNIPSLPMTSVTLSSSPPNIDEYNVWSVLEKLLAATQSMGMLLGSLKDDLRRTGPNLVALEQLKKRREVAMKLWRAFVAYKKSFLDIEIFTRGGNSLPGNQTSQYAGNQKVKAQSAASRVTLTAKGSVVEATGEAAESESEKESTGCSDAGQKRTGKPDEENSVEVKKKRLESEQPSPEDRKASHRQTETKPENDEEGSDEEEFEDNEEADGVDSKSSDVFSAMHFEPLFEIKPIVKKE